MKNRYKHIAPFLLILLIPTMLYAFGWIHIATTTSVSWVSWDETTEAGLADPNIFVCMMEDTDAGDDETGQGGGLAGVNLVLTQAGNLAGMVGGTRTFDGADDDFAMTTVALDTLIANANKTWTIILKLDNLTITNADYFWYFTDVGGTTEIISASISVTEMAGHIEEDTVVEVDLTTDAMLAATEYYVCMWADGTKVYHGFTTTRPTKLSDFAANKRHLFAVNTGDFAGESFAHATERTIMSRSTGGFMAGDLSYVVMAKVCLIDNDL